MIIDEVFKCSNCKQEAEILEVDDYSFCLVCPVMTCELLISLLERHFTQYASMQLLKSCSS